MHLVYRAEKIYENYSNFRAMVTSGGHVRWEPGGVFKTMCQIDITYYPFDEQVSNGHFPNAIAPIKEYILSLIVLTITTKHTHTSNYSSLSILIRNLQRSVLTFDKVIINFTYYSARCIKMRQICTYTLAIHAVNSK